MNLKIIKSFLPPILLKFVTSNLGYFNLAPWEYVKEGFDYPLKSNGWDLMQIAELQKQKWPNYCQRIKSTLPLGINHESDKADGNDPFTHNLMVSFAYVLAMAAHQKKNMNFLDWGGGIGHYGFLAKEVLKSLDLQLNYYCYDFEVFGKSGKELNQDFNFFSNKIEYQDLNFDLAMASSSIWYEKNWKDGVDQLCSYNSKYLYITRMIFISVCESYVAIQRPKSIGYKTEYLFWIINKNEFIEYLKSKGHDLIREFDFGETIPIFKAPEQGKISGYLFLKR
jgi:putative methyltransferase (TIGR04325 family)